MKDTTWIGRTKGGGKKECVQKKDVRSSDISEEKWDRMTTDDWEAEHKSPEGEGGERWGDKRRAWSIWLSPSFVFGLRGGRLAAAGWLAALAPCQATHCATLPRKRQSRTGGWMHGGKIPRPGFTRHFNMPQEAPLWPELNHLTHLVLSVWWGLIHPDTVAALLEGNMHYGLELIIQISEYVLQTISKLKDLNYWLPS